MQIINQRSKAYDFADQPAFANEVKISSEILQKGYDFERRFTNDGVRNEDGSQDFYTFASNHPSTENIAMDDVELWTNALNNCESFEDFKRNAFLIWKVTLPKHLKNWKQETTCSCPSFDETFMCKHILGLLKQILGPVNVEKLEVFGGLQLDEPNYDNEPLFATKKGRPAKATPALVKE